MQIQNYLDSTYLKTPDQADISTEATVEIIKKLTEEAIDNGIFAVIIRPDYVGEIRRFIDERRSNVQLGTVIGFPEGNFSLKEKLEEALEAINNGADELDFVINYEAFKNGEIDLVKEEFLLGTALCLDNHKIVKWIIEIAALNDAQITSICQQISLWAEENFKASEMQNIFIKSSTGFYTTEDGTPNGATLEGITLMLNNSGKLPIKAAGGVKDYAAAVKMVDLGVKRIGTSSAKNLL